LPEDFIKELLDKTCEATMLMDMHSCTWDKETRTLTTPEEGRCKEVTKAFEIAAWFWDEFGLLDQGKKKNSKYIAPQALFNLDGASCKTIHDRHEPPGKTPAPHTPPRHSKNGKGDREKEAVELLDSSSESNNDSHSQSASASQSRDSASQSDSSSKSAGESLEEERPHSDASQKAKTGKCAAISG
jgi:hypothetical protein